ncbi:hypothetical protein PV326_007121 [Microctonus aethiopoides]|nr:hypothetical protein PV326_007121 [Microctonus aethiopoides]
MDNGLSVPSNDPVECIALELSEWGLSKEQMDIETEKMSLINVDYDRLVWGIVYEVLAIRQVVSKNEDDVCNRSVCGGSKQMGKRM